MQTLRDLRRVALGFEIEWVSVPHDSSLANRTIADVAFRQRTGAPIVAIRTADSVEPNPGPNHMLRSGDLLGILGTADQRTSACELVCGPEGTGSTAHT